MKKTLLTTTFLIAGAFGLLGQGLMSFDNNPYNFNDSIEQGGTENYLIYAAPGVPVTDTTWTAALFEGSVRRGSPIPFGGFNAGAWNIGADPDGAEGLRTVGPKGVASLFQVVVYNGQGVEVGRSPTPFSFTPTTSPTPPTDALLMLNFRGFVVPEPSTVALGVLGLGALLLFRRRK